MKTKPNLKIFVRLIVVVFVLVTFWACKDDEDPDPRQSFVNSYEMDDFDVLVTAGGDDSLFNLSSNPEIEFEMEDDLNVDELKVNLEDFINDVMIKTLGTLISGPITIEIDEDDMIAEISGEEFEIDDFNFDFLVNDSGSVETYNCEFIGKGELDGEEVTLEFVITLFTGESYNYVFEGTAVGEVD